MRYVQLPASAMDTQLLEDATRRGKGLLFLLIVCIFNILHSRSSEGANMNKK